jgi:hypothetical protein
MKGTGSEITANEKKLNKFIYAVKWNRFGEDVMQIHLGEFARARAEEARRFLREGAAKAKVFWENPGEPFRLRVLEILPFYAKGKTVEFVPEERIEQWVEKEVKQEPKAKTGLDHGSVLNRKIKSLKRQSFKGMSFKEQSVQKPVGHGTGQSLEQDRSTNANVLESKANRVMDSIWEALIDAVLPMSNFYDPLMERGYYDHN